MVKIKKADLDAMNILVTSSATVAREQVFAEIRQAFECDDVLKGRIYFDEAEDLIQTIIIRLKAKGTITNG